METLKTLNLGLRFCLELGALGIFGYWGFTTGHPALMKFLFGFGAPILCAVIWGMFIAPKSPRRLQEPWLFLLELVIFVLAGWALYSTGKTNLTVAFAGLYAITKLFVVIWRQ